MKKFLITMLILMFSFVLISCGDKEEEKAPTEEVPTDGGSLPVEPTPVTPPATEPNETIDGYTFEGTRTVGPYIVYNQDGTRYEAKIGEETNPNNSLFNAIRLAANNAVNSNKMYVEDANGLVVFQRQKKSDCWCYDGTYFVGSKPRAEAEEWAKGRKRSYVIDGQGLAFQFLGIDWYEGSDFSNPIPLEFTSGGYNYLFSQHGIIEADVWHTLGFGYMEAYCRLSEATYMPKQDNQNQAGDAWNAYIFINGAAGDTCDLGLIGTMSGSIVSWRLVRNCSHDDHKSNPGDYGPSFTTQVNQAPGVDGQIQQVTTMTWDAERKCYAGADDLFFQCWQMTDGWILKITNLRTNEVYTINEIHEGMFAEKQQYMRFLLAASYCPTVMNVWNPRSGGYLRNVVFDGVQIARYNEAEEYTSDLLMPFYPDSNMSYGFSQAADCSSMVYSTYEADGTYRSGLSYKAGTKYLSFSCYYDGGSH